MHVYIFEDASMLWINAVFMYLSEQVHFYIFKILMRCSKGSGCEMTTAID